MRARAPYSILLISFLSVCTLPAFAFPGEATAVIQNCGAPRSDTQQPGGLNGIAERQIVYNGTTLHFQPEVGGWSFTSAWQGDRSVDRASLEQSMPCFYIAMQQAAAAHHDAPILYETYQTSYSQPFGIPYFWLLVILVAALLALAFWIPRRSRAAHVLPDVRRFRRPAILNRSEPVTYATTEGFRRAPRV